MDPTSTDVLVDSTGLRSFRKPARVKNAIIIFVIAAVFILACSAARAGTEVCRSGLEHCLINDERVQRELKLTEAQRDAAWELRWRTSGLLNDILKKHIQKKAPLDQRQYRSVMVPIEAEHATALAKLLTREQFARYEQIRLQYLREEALLEPAVQKAIKLDSERAAKVVSIFLEYREGYDRRESDSLKLPRREQFRLVSKRIAEDVAHREAALKQMRELLTDGQRAPFQALNGPTFHVEGRESFSSMKYQASKRS
jgi:hypothetical protein